MINKLREFISGYISGKTNKKDREDFLSEITLANLSNLRIGYIIILLLHIPFIYIDILNMQTGLWDTRSGYRLLFYNHLVLIALMAVLLIFSMVKRPGNDARVGSWHKTQVIIGVLLVLSITASISVTDQLIHNQITAYIIVIFGMASFICLPAGWSIILYVIPSALFFFGISVFQTDIDILQGHYINGSLLLVISWIYSRVIYFSQLNNFIKTKIITKQKAELEKLSLEDALTGLLNRRSMEMHLPQDFSFAARNMSHITVAMADIDHFKDINDRFNHTVGDLVLKELADIFRQNLRTYDRIYRFGGEEFVIIMQETSIREGYEICERIRGSFEEHNWNDIHPGLAVTLSFGLADNFDCIDHLCMISKADEKLYQAKDAGRNQVVW